ncbi:MAG TPA: hypothetical protein VHB20_04840 [Verrucomicrobiae bacterium]|jgi:hypothetical protein|nr:hypothetical protein [Verrucomicrobiae bacterium]
MADPIPPICDRLVFAGRSAVDLCELRVRGVLAQAGSIVAPDSCYSDALSNVLAYDITTVPWGSVWLFDYGFEVTGCSHSDSLVTLADAEVSFSSLLGENVFGHNGTGPGATIGFGIQKLQVLAPAPWQISFYAASSPSVAICLTNDSLTADAVDPSHPSVVFAAAGSQIIDVPVPSDLGVYALTLCAHCVP